MLGGYSVVDWVTLGGIITAIGGILGTFLMLYRDNKALLRELSDLSKEHDLLLKEFTREFNLLSQKFLGESQPIKRDTTYLVDEMKFEKMARENLYKNSSRAKEILETMDLMKEVVLQNAQLTSENVDLKLKAQLLIESNGEEIKDLQKNLARFESRLSEFEMYRESEEIRSVLKSIGSKLSEYDL